MAYEIPGFSFTLEAAADLSTKLFQAVNVDATGKAVLASDAAAIVGVLNNKPALGEAATIVHSGIAQVRAGAAVAAGALLEVDVAGGNASFITRAAGIPVGRALEAASGDGSIIAALIVPNLL